MNRTALYLLVGVVILGLSLYGVIKHSTLPPLDTAEQVSTEESVEETPAPSSISVSCTQAGDYFLVSWYDAYTEKEKTLVKYGQRDNEVPCAYLQEDGDYEILNGMYDSGTPDVLGSFLVIRNGLFGVGYITVYDLTNKKEVFTDRYSVGHAEAQLTDSSIVYWSFTLPNRAGEDDLCVNKPAGTELISKIRVTLPDFSIEDLNERECMFVQ